MQTFTINNWRDLSIIWIGKANNFGEAVEKALKQGINFCEADCRRRIFCEACFAGENLSGANFAGAMLFGANLDKTDLSNANLDNAVFYYDDICKANIDSIKVDYRNRIMFNHPKYCSKFTLYQRLLKCLA